MRRNHVQRLQGALRIHLEGNIEKIQKFDIPYLGLGTKSRTLSDPYITLTRHLSSTHLI